MIKKFTTDIRTFEKVYENNYGRNPYTIIIKILKILDTKEKKRLYTCSSLFLLNTCPPDKVWLGLCEALTLCSFDSKRDEIQKILSG